MTCPICKKVETKKYRPFCSQKCADLDLGKWLTGAYVISSGNTDEEDYVSSNDLEKQAKLH